MLTVLTIAGSDSIAGAGVQADLKTFAAFGVYGACAITALTAQNRQGVSAVEPVSLTMLEAQIDAVVQDLKPQVWKLGMLLDEERVALVARKAVEYQPSALVVDPVLVSSSGRRLLSEKAVAVMKEELFPLVTVLTPNLPEAQALTGLSVDVSREELAETLLELGPKAILLKGGHAPEESRVQDLLVSETGTFWLTQPRVEGSSPHGTGCTLASALAVLLAKGWSLKKAAEESQRYLRFQIEAAQSTSPGVGSPLLLHSPAFLPDTLNEALL